jgi:pimeloyl-ACP methyl ester carboxylesterase
VALPSAPSVDTLFDFGGTGPLLHFANANGYPPAAYTPLFAALTPRYHVIAMRSRPLVPGANPAALRDWSVLADELIAFLDGQGARGGVGVGHSLGAVTTVLAALRRPELFSAVVAIEPVFFSPLRLTIYDVFRRLGQVDRVHPLIAGARRRRRAFASKEEMFGRFRKATVFRRLDDAALRAYVEAAAAPSPDGQGVTLAISPEWEAAIYATGPYNLWRELSKLKPPLLVIRGAESDTFDRGAVKALQARLPEAQVINIPGTGHLVPMEKPEVVGKAIVEFLEAGR